MLARFLSSPPDFRAGPATEPSDTAAPRRECGRRSSSTLPVQSPALRAAAESSASGPVATGSARRSSALTAGRGAVSSSEVVSCPEEHFPSPSPSMSHHTSARLHSSRTERGYTFARCVVRRVIATVNRLQRITLTVTRTKRPRFAKRPRSNDPTRFGTSGRPALRADHVTAPVQASDLRYHRRPQHLCGRRLSLESIVQPPASASSLWSGHLRAVRVARSTSGGGCGQVLPASASVVRQRCGQGDAEPRFPSGLGEANSTRRMAWP
jgi:hypothetical protein